MITIEEKYKFLLEQLKITHVDRWENDALIELKKMIFFQFSPADRELDIDYCVEQAVLADRWNKANSIS